MGKKEEMVELNGIEATLIEGLTWYAMSKFGYVSKEVLLSAMSDAVFGEPDEEKD